MDHGAAIIPGVFVLFDARPESRYALMDDIILKVRGEDPEEWEKKFKDSRPLITGIEHEVRLYLSGEKVGEQLIQTEADFGEGPEDTGEIPEKKPAEGAKITKMKVVPGIGNLTDIPNADPAAMKEMANEAWKDKSDEKNAPEGRQDKKNAK